MEPTDLTQRLTSIKTHWTSLFRAHDGEGSAAVGARQQLLLRYYGAVYRYLLGMVIYLLGANFIGIFEASFMTANHLNIVLTTFKLFGGTIVVSTSTLLY